MASAGGGWDLLERRGYLLAVPALALLGIFVVFPLVWNLYLSFTDYRLLGAKAREYSIVGLDNYLDLLRDETFRSALRGSLIFTIASAIVGQVVLGLALALVARMEAPPGLAGRAFNTLRWAALTLVFASWIIPEVVAGYAWLALVGEGGLVSRLFGVESARLERPLESIIIANIWRGTAFSMLLFTAALESIPRYIYEAAEVDGAGPVARFRHVTLPLLSTAILVDLILITIWTFNVFTQPYVMLRELGDSVLWTIYVYAEAKWAPSLAAAAANIVFAIVLALIVVYLRVLRRLGGA